MQFVYLSCLIVPFVIVFMCRGSVRIPGWDTVLYYGVLHFPEPLAIIYVDFCTCIHILCSNKFLSIYVVSSRLVSAWDIENID